MKKLALFTLLTFSITSCSNSKYKPACPPACLSAIEISVRAQQDQPENQSIEATLLRKFSDEKRRMVAQYKIDGQGLPPNTKMTLKTLYSGHADPIDCVVMTDSEGHLHPFENAQLNTNEPVFVHVDAIPGARTFLFLVHDCEENGFRLVTPLIPRPLITTSSDGSQMKINRIEKGGNLVLVQLSGFQPGEKVMAKSQVLIYPWIRELTMDADGTYMLALTPTIQNCPGGKCTVTVTRANQAQKLTLSFMWAGDDLTGSELKELRATHQHIWQAIKRNRQNNQAS